ncbi:MAG: hypothetical protein QM692_08450 [Thermomicrobiales bacterium]
MVTRDSLSAKLCKAAEYLLGGAAGVFAALTVILFIGSVFKGGFGFEILGATLVIALVGVMVVKPVRSASKFGVPLVLIGGLLLALTAYVGAFVFSFELNFFGGPSRLPAWYGAAAWLSLVAGVAAIVGTLLVIADSLRYLMRQHHAEQVRAANAAMNPVAGGVTPAPELPVR